MLQSALEIAHRTDRQLASHGIQKREAVGASCSEAAAAPSSHLAVVGVPTLAEQRLDGIPRVRLVFFPWSLRTPHGQGTVLVLTAADQPHPRQALAAVDVMHGDSQSAGDADAAVASAIQLVRSTRQDHHYHRMPHVLRVSTHTCRGSMAGHCPKRPSELPTLVGRRRGWSRTEWPPRTGSSRRDHLIPTRGASKHAFCTCKLRWY
jgi:hypothetical protein